MALSLDGTTGISATGNITGGNVIASGALIVGSFSPASVSTVGNVTGGNLLTGGLISSTGTITGSSHLGSVVSVTGNITGSYILGNGSQLTGVDATQIINGTSNARVVSSGGNIAFGIGGTSNVFVVATTGIFTNGLSSVTGNITGGNLLTGGLISATGAITGSSLTVSTGNITGGNLILSGAIVDSGQLDIQTSAANANIVFTPNGTGNVNLGRLSASGNITAVAYFGSGTGLTSIPGGNVTGTVPSATTAGTVTTAAQPNITSVGTLTGLTINNATTAITNGGTNGVGNIGATGATFNTVFAKATTAQYADLAELYSADATYEPGTVLVFGGNNEVTVSTIDADPRVAGVVSTNPAHLMNSTLDSAYTVAVALTGRVPTQVTGTVRKGDMMVTAANGYAQASAAPAMGTVIGKALENFDGASGTIEIVVGRL